MINNSAIELDVQAGTHNLQTVKYDIDQYLNSYYERQHNRAVSLHTDYGSLWQALVEQHQAGGKRFRPFLCVLAYEIFGGQEYQSILPVASALELLHGGLLIHDDIIDRDYIRHGQPNVAGIYQKKYAKVLDKKTELGHYADSAAMLGGDLLMSDAYQLIISSKFPAGLRIQAAELLGEALYCVIGGELMDTEAAINPPEQADSLKIAELKTATYSCSIPLAIGGMLAEATEASQLTLRQIGIGLGVAFQLADDLLGVFGEESVTGKTVLGDLREGKRTYLLQTTLKLASADQKAQLSKIIGNPNCTNQMANIAREIMINCGAKANTEQLMKQYADQAVALVASLPVNQISQDRLTNFIHQAIWRTS